MGNPGDPNGSPRIYFEHHLCVADIDKIPHSLYPPNLAKPEPKARRGSAETIQISGSTNGRISGTVSSHKPLIRLFALSLIRLVRCPLRQILAQCARISLVRN